MLISLCSVFIYAESLKYICEYKEVFLVQQKTTLRVVSCPAPLTELPKLVEQELFFVFCYSQDTPCQTAYCSLMWLPVSAFPSGRPPGTTLLTPLLLSYKIKIDLKISVKTILKLWQVKRDKTGKKTPLCEITSVWTLTLTEMLCFICIKLDQIIFILACDHICGMSEGFSQVLWCYHRSKPGL